MRKLLGLISALLLSMVLALPALASDRNDGNRGYPGYHHSDSYDRHGDRDDQSGRGHDRNRNKKYDRNDHDRDQGRHYEYRHHERPYKGYRNQPYGRYYNKSHRYHDHDYHYEGHWNSWGDWERYHKIYPKRFHHGRYYHDDDGHLFFRFCDPDGSACLFYSIGR